MTDLIEILKHIPWVAFGIILSIAIPLLRAQLPINQRERDGKSFGEYSKPYLIVAAFSILTSFIILAFLKDQQLEWNGLLLAGYAWDSTLQKIVDKA